MRCVQWIVWVLIAIAVLLIIVAVLSLLFGFNIMSINLISFFHAADSFLLLAIAIFIVTHKCGCCCDSKDKV